MKLNTYGDASLLYKPGRVAVIGSRKASEAAGKVAYNIGKYLAQKGCTVINGLALGIDAESIKGALDANGKIIVFMPCGRDVIYPSSNRFLYYSILQKGGCICSEYTDKTRPAKFRFIERDYLQAAYADCIIVVECKSESGTMHTVRQAHFQKKPIGVIPFDASGNAEILGNYYGKKLENYKDLASFVKESADRNIAEKIQG